MNSIDGTFNSYKEYLIIKSKTRLDELKKIEKSNPEGAKFEAAMFYVMKHHYGLKPEPVKIIGERGADFLCHYNGQEFILEVTHLNSESVERQSGLSKEITNEAKCFQMITHVLESAAKRKIPQVSSYNIPRIICIGSNHPGSTILLGKEGAEWLLTGKQKIAVPVGVANFQSQLVTELENSVFLKGDSEGKIISQRKSISALLLVTVDANSCLIFGILHPEPLYLFHIKYLPDTPFLKVANFPCARPINTEWVINSPSSQKKYLGKIEPTTEELRHF